MPIEFRIPGYSEYQLIGEGAYGYVYKAQQTSSQQLVAIKLLKDLHHEENQTNKNTSRFLREVKLCAQLNHPHIVSLLDSGITADNHHYAVFEFIPGITLADYLAENGALTATETAELMGQVLDALCSAHKLGIVHRDLKPQNIIVSQTGYQQYAKVLDFGISSYVPDYQSVEYTRLTLTREILGTPCYCAPEQLRGDTPGIHSDIYAWGLVVLECLLGEPVIKGNSVAEIYYQQLNDMELPIPPAIISHPLGKLLRKALHKRQDQRIRDGEQLYHDFKAINFSTLVGELNPDNPAQHMDTVTISDATLLAQTVDENVRDFYLIGERRQITSLCCTVEMASDSALSDKVFELQETLLADAKNNCVEIASGFGSYHAGTLANSVSLLFGYPYSKDIDCLQAAKAAQQIIAVQKKFAHKLQQQYDFALTLSIGIHTGPVLIKHNRTPEGSAIDLSCKLSQWADAFSIVISDSSAQLLNKHWTLHPVAPAQGHKLLPSQACFYLTQEPRQTASQEAAALPLKSASFVGRKDEQSRLNHLWQSACHGEGQAVYIYGEAGVGKSRLIRELVRHTGSQLVSIAHGSCSQELKNTALYPVFSIIAALLGCDTQTDNRVLMHRLEKRLQDLGQNSTLLLPIFGLWMGYEAPEYSQLNCYSPQKQKELLFEATTTLILDGNQPGLITIEDLHWADPTTLEWLAMVVERIHSSPMMLVFTSRDRSLAQLPEQACNTIALAKLAQSECLQMLDSVAGSAPIAENAKAFLLARVDGIPLFIEELLRYLAENQILELANGQWQLRLDYEREEVPVTLKDSMSQRLQHTGAAKEIAQIAAVLGRDFEVALLEKVASQDRQEIAQHLDALVACNLIFELSRPDMAGRAFRFRHALLRDSAYESLLFGHRSNLHRKTAQVMEAEFNQNNNRSWLISQLAHHYHLAELHEKAIHFSTLASEKALQRFQLDETIEHAERARTLILDKDLQNAHKLEIAVNGVLIHAVMAKFGWASQKTRFYIQRTHDLTQNIPYAEFDDQTVWALATDFVYYFVSNQRKSLLATCHQVRELANQRQDIALDSVSALMFGFDHYNLAEFDDALAEFQKSTDKYDEKRHAKHMHQFGLDLWVWTTACKGVIYWRMGEKDKAREAGESAVAWAQKLNHMPSLCIALLYRAIVHQYAGDKPGTKAITQRILDIANQYGLPAYIGYASIVHFWADDNQNMTHYDEIIDTLKAMGCFSSLTYYAFLPALVAREQGDVKNAQRRVQQCIELSNRYQENSYLAELIRFRAELGALTQQPDPQQIKNDWQLCNKLAISASLKPLIALSQHHLENLQIQSHPIQPET